MTREELIKAIYDNDDAWSCPEHTCDMPEKEGNTGECCWDCAEKQLKAYEDKIRADVIDEFSLLMKESMNHDWATTKICDMQIYNRLFDKCNEIAEQLKEKNK